MTLELLQEGRGARAIVVVPGFMTNANDLSPWAASLRAGGFGGDVWAVRWKSGSEEEMLSMGGPAGRAALALARLGQVGRLAAMPLAHVDAAWSGWGYWQSKIDLARRIAPGVRRDLLRLRRTYGYRDVTLVAHSLGVELTWTMLEGARSVPADRFVLLGGASSATDGCWEGLEVDADIYNVGHANDWVLWFFYQLAERDLPLGLADVGGQIINVDVGGLPLPGRGHEYSPVFGEFAAPHRWRPGQF